MLEFDSVYVECYDLDALIAGWVIKPTIEDISLYRFSVWRSNTPDTGFTKVVDGLQNLFAYKDADIDLKSKWRKFYYKVQVYLASDLTKLVWSKVTSSNLKPDVYALEIIRRNNLLLKNFVGQSTYAFVRRTWGQRCTACWDAIKQRKTQSNCAVCFNTGWVGGFFDPINLNVNFNPPPEMIRHAQFEIQPEQTVAWCSNFPPLSPKDILVESGRNRWRIVQISKTEKRRTLVHQVLQLTKINPQDIEYTLKIPGSE